MNPYRTEDKPKETPKMLTKEQAGSMVGIRIIVLFLVFVCVAIAVGDNTKSSYSVLVFVPFLVMSYHWIVDYIQRYE